MRIYFLILFLFAFSLVNGQFTEPKFGKISIPDLLMNKYDKDTTAEALMLFDNGNTRFILNTDGKFQFVFERHCRIKIFKKSAFPVADIRIKLYENGGKREALTDLDAATFNLVDGKVVKTKLDNDNILKEEEKKYFITKFAFPQVKEGSILELSYTITSDFFFNLRGWTFQYSYPAVWSQCKYSIPEYFTFRQSSKGYLPFEIFKNEKGSEIFTVHYDAEITTALNSANRQDRNEDYKITTNEKTLAVKDVPAFISEPNIDCEENYLQSIEFELNSIQFPGHLLDSFIGSWETVNKEMNDDEEFGRQLKSNGFIDDTVASLCKNKSTEMEKAHAIYSYVQKRMKWNGDYRLWVKKSLKKIFTDRIGNSSEINLLLTMMLQTAGLKANPVMFSTRDNGIANTFYPTIYKFNSVLTSLEINGSVYLLDVTSKYCPFGVLPANDINGRGRVVNNSEGDWADLTAKGKYKEVKIYALKISADGKFNGSIIRSYDGYAGIAYRNAVNLEKSSDDYMRKLQENSKGLNITHYTISDRDSTDKPVTDTLNVEVTDHAEVIGDKMLFTPLLFETIGKNIYTLEERKYPIDYNYPVSETYIFDYTLPEGYQVESLPKSITMKLPDNSIIISYTLQSNDNKIKVIYRRNISKILFLPGEYQNLKEIYDQIVKKHAEQIILKKVS